MRHVPLNCTCCELYIETAEDGRHATYVLNGVSVVGRDDFAARVGLGRYGLTTRLRRGQCLGGGIELTTGDLAQRFLVNMGRAFA